MRHHDHAVKLALNLLLEDLKMNQLACEPRDHALQAPAGPGTPPPPRRWRRELIRGAGAIACLVLGLAATSTTTACQSCDDYYEQPNYRVHIQDAETGAAVCDASVVLDDGPPVEIHAESCSYVLPIPERNPTATLTVERTGYAAKTIKLDTGYSEDECGHAEVRNETVQLAPL